MARTVLEKGDTIPLIAEVFRELGYEGASLSRITERTGISKGSLYHFFPGGKEEMASEVLGHLDLWFETRIFEPLRSDVPHLAIASMWKETTEYFQSGHRICLVGAFALDETRDRFAEAVQGYFARWIDALASALVRMGVDAATSRDRAEQSVAGIQGGLVLARALNDPEVFIRTVERLAKSIGS